MRVFIIIRIKKDKNMNKLLIEFSEKFRLFTSEEAENLRIILEYNAGIAEYLRKYNTIEEALRQYLIDNGLLPDLAQFWLEQDINEKLRNKNEFKLMFFGIIFLCLTTKKKKLSNDQHSCVEYQSIYDLFDSTTGSGTGTGSSGSSCPPFRPKP